MKAWRLHTTIMLLIISTCVSYAQINPLNAQREFAGGTFITDYEALRVNPAHIALRPVPEKTWSLGLLQTDAIIYSKPLKRQAFHKRMGYRDSEGNIYYPKDRKLNLENILREELSVSTEINWLGFAYHTKKAGSFAVGFNTRINVETVFNDFAHDVLFGGEGIDNYIDTIVQMILDNNGISSEKKLVSLLEDSYIKMNIIHEVSLGYSRQWMDRRGWKLYGGASLGYLLGYTDMALRFNSGNISGYVARVPFLEGDLGAVNMPANVSSKSRNGHGMRTGWGISAHFKDKTRLSISLMDLGFIKWPVNPVIIKEGLEDSIQLERGVNNAFDQLVNDGIFYYLGNKNNTEVLPAKLVLNASQEVHEYIDVYVDLVLPLNQSPKNLHGPFVGVGARLSAMDYFIVKTGLAYYDKKVTMPTYLTGFIGKKRTYEIGLGTADVLSYFISKRDYFQASVAVVRMHF